MICRPSDPTVGRPQAKIRTRYGRSRGKKIHIDCTLYSISVIRRVWDSALQLTCQVKYEERRVKNQLTGASISVPLMRKFNYTKTYTLLWTGVQGFILNLNKFTRYLLNLKRMWSFFSLFTNGPEKDVWSEKSILWYDPFKAQLVTVRSNFCFIKHSFET